MRKWFIFGIIVAAIGALALLWYLNRDDEDVQALTENLVGKLNRGVTVFSGRGGMGSMGIIDSDQPILYCVVTRLEIGSIKTLVNEIDPDAFVVTHSLSDVQGGLIKRPVLH